MEVKKYRSIKIRLLPATNCRGYRVKLIDDYFNQSLIFDRSYLVNNELEDGINILGKCGFDVVGYSRDKEDYCVLCDNWGVKLNDIKKITRGTKGANNG